MCDLSLGSSSRHPTDSCHLLLPATEDSTLLAGGLGRGAASSGQPCRLPTCQDHERCTGRDQGPHEEPRSCDRDQWLGTRDSTETGTDPHVDNLLLGKALFVSDEKWH